MPKEHCEWDKWDPWRWDDQVEVDGKTVECGDGTRTREIKKPAKHGGISCEDHQREETDFKSCPSMNFIQHIS